MPKYTEEDLLKPGGADAILARLPSDLFETLQGIALKIVETHPMYPGSDPPFPMSWEDDFDCLHEAVGLAYGVLALARWYGKVEHDVDDAIAEILPKAALPISTKPNTAKALLQSLEDNGVVGMWKDRQDIGDSSDFAARLRGRVQELNDDNPS